MASKGSTVEVDGRELSLTNLDKILYPSTGTTKGEVIDYYARIADLMVPHLRGRPITLRRFPNGVGDARSFFEKRCPEHRPKWVKTTEIYVSARAGKIPFCRCEDRPTLTWMAQLAALELHPSLSLVRAIKRPTILAFDLDPGPPAALLDCCRVALRVRDLFGALGLECFPKTSGGKGMQVYVPLNNPKATYDQTKPFSQAVAQLLEKQTPGEVVSQMKKELRRGKVFVDWSQNDEHKTTIAVYSLRARDQPTVSTPLEWKEVEKALRRKDAEPLRFDFTALLKRVARKGDLFAPVLQLEQTLPKLDGLAKAAG
ncbi:MAG: non-homologous end-joining DNA ligase [Solirubrobacterales bacterium]